MKFKTLKEILNKLPEELDDTEVFMTHINEKGYGFHFPLDKVVYGSEVILWGDYHKEQD